MSTMPTPTLTLRKVMNRTTGIDISVPSFREVEAPLGGKSVEYEISVLTRLQCFKTSLHKENDVVHFSLFKAFREIEDLHRKLCRKFPSLNMPLLHKGNSCSDTTVNERIATLDNLMKFIAENSEVSCSSIFLQFVGINLQKISKTCSVASDTCLNKDVVISDKEVEIDGLFSKIKNIKDEEMNVLSKAENVSANESEEFLLPQADSSLSESYTKSKSCDEYQENDLFPKVKLGNKNEKKKNTMPEKSKDKNSETKSPASNVNDEENEDIFEEVKKIKKENSPFHNHEKKAYIGLFQGGDDVFSSPALVEKNSKKPFLFESEISSKNMFENTEGGLKLFQDQDYGEAITADEELLFLVSQDENRVSRANSLLMPKKSIISELEHLEIKPEDRLEDLLHLDPLPEPKIQSSVVNRSNEHSILSVSSNELPTQTSLKPVPKPRTKLSSNSDKPKIVPRCHPPKPAVSSKPVLPPKPSVLKTKSLTTAGRTSLQTSSVEPYSQVNAVLQNQPDESSLVSTHLDILKYIEQEQKFKDAEPSLFD